MSYQPRSNAGKSLTVPFLLAILAPTTVILGVLVLHSVWWTFAFYQGVICLIAPAIESRINGRGWREHAALLGLVETTAAGAPNQNRRRLLLAVGLGLLTALV